MSILGKRRHIYIDQATVESDSARGTFQVSEDLKIFESHFPGDPILPGVVQGQMLENMCVRLLENSGLEAFELQGFDSLKFKSPIRPGVLLSISCQLSSKDETLARFSGTIKDADNDTVYAAGKLSFRLGQLTALPACPDLESKDIAVTKKEIDDLIPHGPDISFCDEVNKIDWCPRIYEMLENGQRSEILFPDLIGSVISSRVHLGDDRFLLDYDANGELVLPASNHVEISAQAGIFLIWGIKPEGVEIQTILLGYSGEYLNPIPPGITLENQVKLVQSRGNPQKGYMNFFEAEISCGDIVFSRLKYSAICTYLK